MRIAAARAPRRQLLLQAEPRVAQQVGAGQSAVERGQVEGSGRITAGAAAAGTVCDRLGTQHGGQRWREARQPQGLQQGMPAEAGFSVAACRC